MPDRDGRRRELCGLWPAFANLMRRFLVRFIRPESFVHTRSRRQWTWVFQFIPRVIRAPDATSKIYISSNSKTKMRSYARKVLSCSKVSKRHTCSRKVCNDCLRHCSDRPCGGIKISQASQPFQRSFLKKAWNSAIKQRTSRDFVSMAVQYSGPCRAVIRYGL
jgi:hypothetical protein